MKLKPYPSWVCADCAEKAGGNMPAHHIATWHNGKCGVCEQEVAVTEPRDYRHPKFKGFKSGLDMDEINEMLGWFHD